MSGKVQLSNAEFNTRFAENAILIKKGGHEISEHEKITAFRCEDDITVFAVEREKGKIKAIMAWRLYTESVVDIQLKFHELIEPNADCRFYIIGGCLNTTLGTTSLLGRIREAISGYFNQPNMQIERRDNQSVSLGYKYVTAKLEMNGELT